MENKIISCAAVMRRHIEACNAGGTIIVAYCKAHGLAPSNYYYRQQKLKHTATKAGFVQLPSSLQSPATSSFAKISLPNGIVGIVAELRSDTAIMLIKEGMLHLSPSCRYFYYNGIADMRKGAYSLSGLVRNEMNHDVLSGDVFIFIGRRANKIKLLQWDTDGFALYEKRLFDGV